MIILVGKNSKKYGRKYFIIIFFNPKSTLLLFFILLTVSCANALKLLCIGRLMGNLSLKWLRWALMSKKWWNLFKMDCKMRFLSCLAVTPSFLSGLGLTFVFNFRQQWRIICYQTDVSVFTKITLRMTLKTHWYISVPS